jgi:signal recognition particle subunit SRP54
MASRILGLGDILALVDTARQVVTEEQQKELEERLRAGEFTLDDFKNQLEAIAKPGLMKKLMGLMPGMGDISSLMSNMEEEMEPRRLIGIINSMTAEERRNPKLIDPSRRNRIARGAGAQTQEVSQLIKQYDFVAPFIKAMANKGMGARMRAIQELQQSGALDPSKGGNLPKLKGSTGKRLSAKEKADLRKQREKEMRRRKRIGRSGADGS